MKTAESINNKESAVFYDVYSRILQSVKRDKKRCLPYPSDSNISLICLLAFAPSSIGYCGKTWFIIGYS